MVPLLKIGSGQATSRSRAAPFALPQQGDRIPSPWERPRSVGRSPVSSAVLGVTADGTLMGCRRVLIVGDLARHLPANGHYQLGVVNIALGWICHLGEEGGGEPAEGR